MSDDPLVPDAEPAQSAEGAPSASHAAGKSVSFQTASGKAVSFTASKRTKKAKVVVEAPVEEPPPEPPELKRSSAAQSVEAVPEALPEALPEKKPRGRPKGSTKKPAPGIQERLPPKQPITEVAPLPATPEPPAYPRMTQDEFHGLMTEYMQTSRSQRRDARLAMYRSWLST